MHAERNSPRPSRPLTQVLWEHKARVVFGHRLEDLKVGLLSELVWHVLLSMHGQISILGRLLPWIFFLL